MPAFSAQNVHHSDPAILWQSVLEKISSAKPLSITSIMLSGTNSGDFFAGDTCPRNPNILAPKNHCTITAIFSPTEAGTLTADVTITDNASASPLLRKKAAEIRLLGTKPGGPLAVVEAEGCDHGWLIVWLDRVMS